MKLKLGLISALLFLSFAGYGQTILAQENFETGGGSFFINFPGVGTNSGTNEWIINNSYTGGPITMSEDSTFGGTISYAPFGHYLHIYDQPSTWQDCLYNPVNQSDRFAYTWNGTCTYTYSNVSVNFFYLCQGSPTAYGTVYYSAENGPWTQCGAVQYNNKYKWQYATITNPAFNNISGLRIGFRWQNNSGSGTDTSAFAIDDFSITGTLDTVTYPSHITTVVTPDTICADESTTINLTFTLSDSLCDGSYDIYLIDSTNTVVAGWTATGYALVNGPYALTIPNNITGSHCYRWVVNRSTPPAINGVITGCFYVKNCPNTITTNQPSATIVQPVCAGSTLMIPFFSTGTWGNLNQYFAELSDSAGNFTPHHDTLSLSSLISNQSYPAPNPGSVIGQIPYNVPAGCNYYIRVVSDTPHIIGTTFGPFCIDHCDASSSPSPGGGGPANQNTTYGIPVIIQACIKSCYADPTGYNDTIHFDLHSYDHNIHYLAGNKFNVELLSTQNLAVVNNTGLFGSTTDTVNGKLVLHVPCADSICSLLNPFGGGPDYFVRLVATNSNPSDSNLGPLMLLSIGYPSDSTELGPETPSKFCVGGTPPTYYAYPFNGCTESWISPLDSYTWYINNTIIPNITTYGVSFNYPVGTYSVMCKEENNGCYGPLDTVTFTMIGSPNTAMTGPTRVCFGDTATYYVPFTDNTIYKWTAHQVKTLDTANNVLKVRFDSMGTFTINVVAFDSCGFQPGSKRVTVVAAPKLNYSGPTTVCAGSPLQLNVSGATSYKWTPTAGLSCSTCSNPIATINTTTQFTVAVTNSTCTMDDSLKLTVLPAPSDTACCDQTIKSGQSVGIEVGPGAASETYSWQPTTGLSCTTCTTPIASPTVTTTYSVTVTNTTDDCERVDSVTIHVTETCGKVFVPTAFSPNGDGQNDELIVKAPQCVINADFIIYDRWGNKVFETTDLSKGWDGKYNGAPMNTGTYVYYLTGTTNETVPQIISMKGNITLVR